MPGTKLTPEKEARLAIALTCLLHLKEAEHALQKAILAHTEALVRNTPMPADKIIEGILEAQAKLAKLGDELTTFRLVVRDDRTPNQRTHQRIYVRTHGSERGLEPRFRDPRALIFNMAERIIARRAAEEDKPC